MTAAIPDAVTPEERKVARRVSVAGLFTAPPGLVRGFIAVWLAGTLIALQFASPGETSLGRVLQTLVIAVVAFYFGGRRSKTPSTEVEPGPDSNREPSRSQPPGMNRRDQ
jgi:hypothetical protein